MPGFNQLRRLAEEKGDEQRGDNQEQLALSALLDRLDTAAQASGGDAPGPEADKVPNMATDRGLSGNDLLAEMAADATTLRATLKTWQESSRKINERMPNWHLAERLVRLGATEKQADIDSIRSNRQLLADPDPVPPLISAAADALRGKLNDAHAAWQAAWDKGEARLNSDPTWAKLTPEQKHDIRQDHGVLLATKPAVDTPQSIAEALVQRSLSDWENLSKALPTRIEEALDDAAALLEPKAHTVNLPGALVKSEAELDEWLTKVRVDRRSTVVRLSGGAAGAGGDPLPGAAQARAGNPGAPNGSRVRSWMLSCPMPP